MRKGEKMSAEQKEKIGRANRGRKCSPETIEKLKKAGIGRTPSPQNRLAVSKAMMGNKFALGNKLSSETRAKMSRSALGKKKSPESIRKSVLARSGDKNYNWRGGKSREPYQHGWTRLAKDIRRRDEGMCQHPCCYKIEMGDAHHVHHIDFNKGNNDPGNLITLCRGHHVSTYFGEIDYWVGFYQSIQEMRGINPHQKGGF
jgi:hypothetical protein